MNNLTARTSVNTRMQHQGGWAASFVIVGTLLTAGLLGGLYFVRIQHENAQIANVHEQETNTSTTTGDSKSETNKNDESKDADNDEKPSSSGEPQPASPEPSDREDSETANTSDDALPGGSALDEKNAELPTTGPADAIGSLVAVAVLSFVVAFYLQSRRV